MALKLRARRVENGALRLDKPKLAFALNAETKLPQVGKKLLFDAIEALSTWSSLTQGCHLYEHRLTKGIHAVGQHLMNLFLVLRASICTN